MSESQAGQSNAEPCPFCGKVHGPGPVGQPGSAFAGIEFKVCPKLPPDHIYEDREFESGPRGALHKLDPEADA